MNKKILAIVLILGLIILAFAIAYPKINSDKNNNEKTDTEKNDNDSNNDKNNIALELCSGCKFMYLPNKDIWTSWNTEGKTPTVVSEELSDDYLDIVKTSNKRYFLGVKLNNKNEITNAYACGTQENIPFCVEASKDRSRYAANKTIIEEKVWNEFCTITDYDDEKLGDYESIYCAPSVELLGVNVVSNGIVRVGDDNDNVCVIGNNGYVYCKEQ